jgi:hypothetical protein
MISRRGGLARLRMTELNFEKNRNRNMGISLATPYNRPNRFLRTAHCQVPQFGRLCRR